MAKAKISLAPVKALSEPPVVAAKAEVVSAKAESAAPAPEARPAPEAKSASEAKPIPQAKRAPAAKPAVAPKAAAAKVAAPVVSAAAAVEETFPRPYAALSALAENLAQHQLAVAREIGVLQGKLLDYAVSELSNSLTEAEQIAGTPSLSDAVQLQAKAFRRGHDAFVACLTDVAQSVASAAKPR